jgi:hypothetical protein
MVYLFVLIIAGVMGYYRKTPTRDEAPNPHNPQEACDKAIAALNAVHAQVCARDAATIAGSGAALASALASAAAMMAARAAYLVSVVYAAYTTSRNAQDNLALAQIERRKARDNVSTTCPQERALATASLPPCS